MTSTGALDAALAPTWYIESDHPAVLGFVAEHAGAGTPEERVVRLYYAVRDGFRYDPYSIRLDPRNFRATTCLEQGAGYCINKAILLAAAARAVGVPARLGFADVRNHLASPRLIELLGTDVFYWHGYTSLWLGGRWVKATPAFNIELCERFGVRPLEFDGRADSVFHEFDTGGRRHMEYIREHGDFDDLPYERLTAVMLAEYPRLFAGELPSGDFHAEAEPIRG
ncbi:transglutaminase superfamily protein [Tepidamorphus gemmatus]|uniref:Transglutaminase superfamily protein n=1 Tax=Tepidamorphus gemmatus TaxID=747076 RepID=A0A4R3MCY9_9HYPH|nr:transglutaminase-like domain-containing protein [Tepidamorphus gemmatus]TCT09897.1 transglutaminase superfamily protein [Tepidamorphus gemmatus]